MWSLVELDGLILVEGHACFAQPGKKVRRGFAEQVAATEATSCSAFGADDLGGGDVVSVGEVGVTVDCAVKVNGGSLGRSVPVVWVANYRPVFYAYGGAHVSAVCKGVCLSVCCLNQQKLKAEPAEKWWRKEFWFWRQYTSKKENE